MEQEPRLSEQEIRDQNRRLAIRGLRERLDATRHEAGTEALRTDFERVYEKLPEVSDRIIGMYRSVLAKYNLDPGEVRLIMVGGRVKGRSLKEGSDIDLVFETSDSKHNAETLLFERFANPLDAQDFRIALKEEILNGVKRICQEEEIPNLFHILNYGRSLSEEGQHDDRLEISRGNGG